MPLTSKGEEIKENMEKEYGEKKGTSVFYASANKGTITGVHDQAMPPDPPVADDCPQRGYMDAVRRGDAAGMDRHRARMLGKG